jgi:hypothetical protein
MGGINMPETKSSSAKIQHLRSELLRDGMTTYPLAMQAIAEFQHEIFAILERVAKRREKAIRHIVGDPMTKRESDEVETFLADADTALSVSTSGPCWFDIYVCWEDLKRNAPLIRIGARTYFDTRAKFEKVDKALQHRFGSRFKTYDEDRGCGFGESIAQEQIGQLESRIRKATDKWIKMLGAVDVSKLIRSKQ